MAYSITLFILILLAVCYTAIRFSTSLIDAVGRSLGIIVGAFTGASYGLYLIQPYLLWPRNLWPVFAAMILGSTIGLFIAIYTSDSWHEPLSLCFLRMKRLGRSFHFSLKSLLICYAVLAVLGASAWWAWLRPSAFEREMTRISHTLTLLPMELGPWHALEHGKVMRETSPHSWNSGLMWLVRQYRDTNTGEIIELHFFAGHIRDINHVCPENSCLRGSYEFAHSPVTLVMSNNWKPVVCRAFSRRGSNPREVYYWTMTNDGRWKAPENSRLGFEPYRIGYKMYLMSKHPVDVNSDESMSAAAILIHNFAKELFPRVNDLLYPDS